MPKNLSRLLLRASLGFIIGLAVWGGLSVPYTRLVGYIAETALRVLERPSATRLTPDGTLLIVDRSDLPSSPASQRLAVESTDVTFNVIVLLALFAASTRPLGDRNMFGLAAAAVSLMFVHVAAVMSFVMGHYVTNFGAWSTSHYGFLSRHFWSAAPYFYSVVGSYGSALALWWLFRPSPDSNENTQVAGAAPRARKRVHA